MNAGIAILLPVHNRLDLTKKTLEELSMRMQNSQHYKFYLVLIDDGSTDGTAEWVKHHYPEVIILMGDGNLWWSGAVNLGAKYALETLNASYLFLYNNDIHLKKDYLPELLKILAENDSETIIGSKIYIAEQPDLIWSMGGYFNPKTGKYGMYGYYEKDSPYYNSVFSVDWFTGMGTVIPKEVIEKIGFWDNINFPQYHGDSDFTYRAKKAGFKLLVNPALKIYNSVKHSGIEHEGSFKKLIQLITDIRSKSNFVKNFRFYRRYATSIRAYFPLVWSYFKIFGGFFKWKILTFLHLKAGKNR